MRRRTRRSGRGHRPYKLVSSRMIKAALGRVVVAALNAKKVLAGSGQDRLLRYMNQIATDLKMIIRKL